MEMPIMVSHSRKMFAKPLLAPVQRDTPDNEGER
jgi:hypothetical protein